MSQDPAAKHSGDDLLTEIREKLEAFGVSNFVVAFSDPDDNMEKVGVYGSLYWRLGFGQDLIDETRRCLAPNQGDDSEPT